MSTCRSSGGRRGLMELCPEKLALVECPLRLIEAECDAMACLTFAGLAGRAI
jgi:hypothetical protein